MVGAQTLPFMPIHYRELTWKTCLRKRVSHLKTSCLIVWLSQPLNVNVKLQLAELSLSLTSTTIAHLSSLCLKSLKDNNLSVWNLMPPQSVPSTQADPSSPIQIALSRIMANNRALVWLRCQMHIGHCAQHFSRARKTQLMWKEMIPKKVGGITRTTRIAH